MRLLVTEVHDGEGDDALAIGADQRDRVPVPDAASHPLGRPGPAQDRLDQFAGHERDAGRIGQTAEAQRDVSCSHVR